MPTIKHPMPYLIWKTLQNRVSNDSVRTLTFNFTNYHLSDPHMHYAIYDSKGVVHTLTRTFINALIIRKQTGLFITRILN